jgi:hypothetical protein
MSKAPKITDPVIIKGVYDLLGLTAAPDRALVKVVVILEPGKPVLVTENSLPLIDMPDDAEKQQG